VPPHLGFVPTLALPTPRNPRHQRQDDTLSGFVLDTSALAALGGGENIYATTWADRAAVRGLVLLVPATALSEAWQQIRRHTRRCCVSPQPR
jgi:hypothetical protein